MNNYINNEQKNVAISIMNQMKFDQIIIDDFIKNGNVYLFDTKTTRVVGAEDGLILDQIKELEKKGDLVYAVIYSEVYGFKIYNFLLVSRYDEDWNYQIQVDIFQELYSVQAYCLNITKEAFSESGSIGVIKTATGFKRVG